jgi:hypothetical protein
VPDKDGEPTLREVGQKMVDYLSDDNIRKTHLLAEARIAGPVPPSFLPGRRDTYDVKVPRYLMADLMRALAALDPA